MLLQGFEKYIVTCIAKMPNYFLTTWKLYRVKVKLCDKLGLENCGKEIAIVEVDGLQSALATSVLCSICGSIIVNRLG